MRNSSNKRHKGNTDGDSDESEDDDAGLFDDKSPTKPAATEQKQGDEAKSVESDADADAALFEPKQEPIKKESSQEQELNVAPITRPSNG